MKYIHTVALLTALLIALTSCSPDVEKEDGILVEMNEDGVTVTTTVDGVTTVHHERAPDVFQPKPEPQPDWADNVVTITVGRFDTKEDMVSEFRKKKEEGMILDCGMGFWVNTSEHHRGEVWEESWITEPEDAYTVGITLINMQDAGFKKPATIAEVRDRIIEMGFEPITFEEAHEMRLQLKDQPDWRTTKHPWSNFKSLPLEEEMRRIYGGKEISLMIRNLDEKYSTGIYTYQELGPGIRNDELLIPSEEFREQSPRGSRNPNFACAIPETRRRK